MTMSRSDYYEDSPYTAEFWMGMVRRSFQSKAGKARLAELREILRAMPRKRLLHGQFANEEGDVCVVGAWVVAHDQAKTGDSWVEAARKFKYVDEGIVETATYGKANGLGWVMSWDLTQRNDDRYAKETPEERYDRFMEYLDKELA